MAGKNSRQNAGDLRRLRRRTRVSVPTLGWDLDPRSPEFAREAHRQSLAIANSPSEADDQAFIDSVSVWNEDE